MIDGDAARFVSAPAAVERSCAVHVAAPVVAVTVAPGPVPLLSPYVIVAVAPPASVRLETVIVRDATVTVPSVAVE